MDQSQLTWLNRGYDAAHLTPSTDGLRPDSEKRRQEGLALSEMAFQAPTTNDSRNNNQYDRLLAPSQAVGNSSLEVLNDHSASLERYEDSAPTQMMAETLRHDLYHHGSTQGQVHNASYCQSLQAAVPAELVATPDARQSGNFFQNAHGFSINGNPRFQNQNIGSLTNVYGGVVDGLDFLKGFVSFDAQFDSFAQDPQRRCHPGTRQNVLKRLRDWIDNPNSTERIVWLYGPAGAGKSAIAQTIAHSYDRSKVAATFFFFKSDANRNDGNQLFTTLAYQLAFSMPAIRVHIANSLIERPDLPRTGIETQFNQLLVLPFQVLSEDAAQQFPPAVRVIKDIVKKYQKLAPVIIIDGVDECADENLQRRFLRVIGDAVKDDRFPLRFLIVSRPERHIEHSIQHFQTHIPSIDLAKLDDANRDIEKFLVDQFSRIASEQGLDPTWPGKAIIDDIVYKSSGNFIYASVIIKFVGDQDCFAKTQLDIILNIKPPKTMSPFAILDQLFIGILKRVPDQDFLKRYLALLTARISVSESYNNLHEDDAILMHVSEEELHANLRRMCSLLVFKPQIDVHHLSFLDFLHDSSRSSEYYIDAQGGIRRYLELFVDSFVRYVSTVTERPDHNNIPHFMPKFREMMKNFPRIIELPANEWQEVIQPVLDLQDNLLQLPNFVSTWHLLPCDTCTVVQLLRELLHLGLYLRRFHEQPNVMSVQSVIDVRKRRGVVSSITTQKEKMYSNGLDRLLLTLFARLPDAMEIWLLNEELIKLMSAILRFDSAEIARRVRFVSDAQKLVDLLVYLIDEKNVLSKIHPDATRKATLLALEIFARVPILPLSPFLNRNTKVHLGYWPYLYIPIQILAQTIFASWILDRRYVIPVLFVMEGNEGVSLANRDTDTNDLSMKEWRRRLIPSSVTVIQVMFRLAKAIQYFHSMNIILYCGLNSNNICLDSSLCPKIRSLFSTSRSLLDMKCKEWFSLEENIFSFGCLFYELLSGVDTKPRFSSEKERRDIIKKRPSVLEIPEYAWQLIQRCCTQDLGRRPTMDEIVLEMQRWK